MIKQKSFLESAIERRNVYQDRFIDAWADKIYFDKQRKKLKANSQARVDAENSFAEAQKRISQDKILLNSFDELIDLIKGGKIV